MLFKGKRTKYRVQKIYRGRDGDRKFFIFQVCDSRYRSESSGKLQVFWIRLYIPPELSFYNYIFQHVDTHPMQRVRVCKLDGSYSGAMSGTKGIWRFLCSTLAGKSGCVRKFRSIESSGPLSYESYLLFFLITTGIICSRLSERVGEEHVCQFSSPKANPLTTKANSPRGKMYSPPYKSWGRRAEGAVSHQRR